MERLKRLIALYVSFFKMGIITFGGGYAMLPILQREVVEKQKWATEEELLNYFAVGQCTPGIIAVNTATFIGQKQEKTLGAIFATLGLVSPSILIIVIIGAFLEGVSDNEYLQHAFAGIRVAVAALVTETVIKLWNSSIANQNKIKKPLAVGMFVFTMIMSIVFNWSPVWFVLGSIGLGIFLELKKNSPTANDETKEDK